MAKEEKLEPKQKVPEKQEIKYKNSKKIAKAKFITKNEKTIQKEEQKKEENILEQTIDKVVELTTELEKEQIEIENSVIKEEEKTILLEKTQDKVKELALILTLIEKLQEKLKTSNNLSLSDQNLIEETKANLQEINQDLSKNKEYQIILEKLIKMTLAIEEIKEERKEKEIKNEENQQEIPKEETIDLTELLDQIESTIERQQQELKKLQQEINNSEKTIVEEIEKTIIRKHTAENIALILLLSRTKFTPIHLIFSSFLTIRLLNNIQDTRNPKKVIEKREKTIYEDLSSPLLYQTLNISDVQNQIHFAIETVSKYRSDLLKNYPDSNELQQTIEQLDSIEKNFEKQEEEIQKMIKKTNQLSEYNRQKVKQYSTK